MQKGRYNMNICKDCKHFCKVRSSSLVFTEKIELCDELNIEWPSEIYCKYFKQKDDKNDN